MEHSNMSPIEEKPQINVTPPERPMRTYQRTSKAALQKQIHLDQPKTPDIDISDDIKSIKLEEKDKDNSDTLSARQVPREMLVIDIEEVMSSTHFDPDLLNAVKDRSPSTTFKAKPKALEKVLTNSLISKEVPTKPTASQSSSNEEGICTVSECLSKVSQEVIAKPIISEVSLKVSEGIPAKAKPAVSESSSKVSQGVPAKPAVSERVRDSPKLSVKASAKANTSQVQMKPKMSAKVFAKSDISDVPLQKPKAPKKTLGHPALSKSVPAKPVVSKGVVTKLKVPQGVQEKPKVLKRILARPARSEVLAEPTASEGGLAKQKVYGGVKAKCQVSKTSLLRAKVAKAIVTKSKVLKQPSLNPKALKVAIVKDKVCEGKPKEPGMSLLKPQIPEGTVGSGPAVLLLQPLHEGGIGKPKAPGTESCSQVETREPIPIPLNLPEYVKDFDPALHVSPPKPLTLFPLTPIPLPAVKDESTAPVDAVKRLKEILTPQLPRRWTLRVEDDAIYPILFAPGPKCVVQRAVYAPYDGSQPKLIVHAREIPANHWVYQYRLMKPPVKLTEESVKEFASATMGAVHSIIQQYICVGLNEDQFIEEWQEYTDECRLDENLFDEEGYEKTLRPLDCSYLLRRRSTKRCPECSWYYTHVRGHRKRRKADKPVEVDIQVIMQKKLRNV